MPRSEALIRLHQTLSARRNELRRRLGGDLKDLGHLSASSATGDAADAAFDTGSDEIVSKLAEFEARELKQVERAMLKLHKGTYGVCEGCQIKIPVARLNALPYCTHCLKCQREVEEDARWGVGRLGDNWEKVVDGDGAEPNHVNLSELEMDFTK